MTTERVALLAQRLAPAGVTVRTQASLAAFTTYRVGGPAEALVETSSVPELVAVSEALRADPRWDVASEVRVVGNGSNLLVADDGFPGLVVHLAGPSEIEIEGTVVRAGAAALLPVVARRSVAAGLGGFEWAVGVPGSIGGAVKMNAGGHGSDMAATLRRVHRCDLSSGETGWMSATGLRLGYRTSAVGPTSVVTAAELVLRPSPVAAGEAMLSEIVRWRREHQPGGANAGSVFRNPPEGPSAGALIESAGCSGLRLGGAQVSTKHANFIQVDPGGTAADVVAVIRAVQRAVRQRHGVQLQCENELMGFEPPSDPSEGNQP